MLTFWSHVAELTMSIIDKNWNHLPNNEIEKNGKYNIKNC